MKKVSFFRNFMFMAKFRPLKSQHTDRVLVCGSFARSAQQPILMRKKLLKIFCCTDNTNSNDDDTDTEKNHSPDASEN